MDTLTSTDQFLLDVERGVMRHGYTVIPVGYGGCSTPGCRCGPSADPWAYTVGFTTRGLPELVITGATAEVCSWLVATVHSCHERGHRFVSGDRARFGTWRVQFEAVPIEWLMFDPNRMGTWFASYGPGRTDFDGIQIQQVLWAPPDEPLPSDPGAPRHVLDRQPRLSLDPYGYPARLVDRPRRRGARRPRDG